MLPSLRKAIPQKRITDVLYLCIKFARCGTQEQGNGLIQNKQNRPLRLHIVGSSPRSGTTLMFELVVACFDIEKVGDHEIGLLEANVRTENNYCTKKPNDLAHVTRVLKWDSSLFVIYMQRDPRDVVVSRHGSAPDMYWCDFDLWSRNQKWFAKIAEHPRVLEVKYEDLVSDPNTVQEVLLKKFRFLETRYLFSSFHEVSRPSENAKAALGGVRKISAQSIGTWKSHLPRLAQQVDNFPGFPDELIAAGYENNSEWLKILHGVAPDPQISARKRADPTTRMGKFTYVLYRIRQRVRTLWNEAHYVLRQNL